MVRSGFIVSDEAKNAYTELQAGHKHHYIIFKVDNITIVPEKIRTKDDAKFDYAEFEAELSKADGARYAVLDYHFEELGQDKSKIVFFLWSPDDKGSVAARLKYSSSKEEFKRNLNGIQKDIEAHSEADIEESAVLAKCTA
jgi:cofilin